MELFLDEFERENTRHLSFRVDPEGAVSLVEGLDVSVESPVEVEVDVERVDSTFVVDSQVDAELSFICGRCLRRRTETFSMVTQWILMAQSDWLSAYEDEEIELNEEDLDVSFYEGDSIVIDDLVREAIVLETTGKLKCPEGDPECEEAYQAALGEDVLKANEEDAIDLRWAPLKDIELADNGD